MISERQKTRKENIMRRPIIAGNWKMYKDINESIELSNAIKRGVFDAENVEIVVCPPFTNLSEVGEMFVGTNVGVGAQNCHWEKEGAFTGEISVAMIKSVNCAYVIIGHSERRKFFGETDETVNKKVASVIGGGLVPIMCVGETLEEREGGKTMDVVKKQVLGGLEGFGKDDLEELIIAYEPVWAIGTGKTATPSQAEEVHGMIRSLLAERFSSAFADALRILYGGSVNPGNVKELMWENDIDGGLIGGASLKPDSFIEMVKTTSQLYAEKKG
jgi:triosephosphate isomerase (TIM)